MLAIQSLTAQINETSGFLPSCQPQPQPLSVATERITATTAIHLVGVAVNACQRAHGDNTNGHQPLKMALACWSLEGGDVENYGGHMTDNWTAVLGDSRYQTFEDPFSGMAVPKAE